MTNVVLAMVGILLAALSVLITVDYGGDYYVDSKNSANAGLLMHAGSNIQYAYDLHVNRYSAPPSNLTALVSATGYRAFLTSLPMLAGNGTYNTAWSPDSSSGTTHNRLIIEGVPTVVCRAVNKRANNFANPDIIPTATAFREGCVNNVAGQPVANNTYYRYMSYP